MSNKTDLKIVKINLKTSLTIWLVLLTCRPELGDWEVGQTHFNEVLPPWNALPDDEKGFCEARNLIDHL